MFRSTPADATPAEILSCIKAWTRQRFGLDPADVVMAAEVRCMAPGCPPLETVVVFWQGSVRYQFKVFKPMAQLVEEDLPYSWLKESLAAIHDAGYDCC